MRRKIGDRRIRPRFDIVGDLWGTLETVLQLPLRNVSRGGALIHSHVPLPSQSVHRLAFNADGAAENSGKNEAKESLRHEAGKRHVRRNVFPDALEHDFAPECISYGAELRVR